MNRIALVLCLSLLVAITSCGKKEQPAPPPPQPQAQVEKPAPPPPKPEPKPEPAPAPEPEKPAFKSIPGDFTIQVAAWETREDAQKLADFYNGKGYDARVEQADVKGGEWYRVRIGMYKNSGDAHEVAEQIAEKYKSDIWLIKL